MKYDPCYLEHDVAPVPRGRALWTMVVFRTSNMGARVHHPVSDSKLKPVRLQVNANYRAQLHKTDWVLLHGITDVTCCQRAHVQ
jgi:hypothetical protein